MLFDALDESELDSRIAEGLPWRRGPTLTWIGIGWRKTPSCIGAKTGWASSLPLALDLARATNENERTSKLRWQLERLESIRLAEEDTFCHDSLTTAERAWLREHRSPMAAHWNILSDIRAENLGANRY